MQFSAPVSLSWIASFINAEIVGNANGEATGINELHNVQPGDIVYVDHPKYYDK
jgi:UDP-3-O-[3-hydroxymyristoyl] glucosamine N-acyltransferase